MFLTPFNFGCKTTMFFGIHRYAKYSSLWNKKRAVKGASFFTILKGYFSRSQGHKFGNLSPSPFFPNLLFDPN